MAVKVPAVDCLRIPDLAVGQKSGCEQMTHPKVVRGRLVIRQRIQSNALLPVPDRDDQVTTLGNGLASSLALSK